MDIILAVFIILILIGCKPKVEADYLSKESTMVLRGILAIAIILHHISENIESGFVFPYMVHVGYMIVAVFFFLSGYGLSVQYRKKGKVYLQFFFRNRIVYIFLVWLFFGVIYYSYYNLIGTEVTIKNAFISYISDKPIVKHSWYIAVQLWMYVFFFLVYSLPMFNEWLRVGGVALFLVLLAVVYTILGYNTVWFISNGAFAVGLAYPLLKNTYDLFSKKYWIICILLWVISIIFILYSPVMVEHYFFVSPWTKTVSRIISTMMFVMVITTFLQKFQIKCGLWSFLGKYSLEIYLIHGLFMNLFRSNRLYITSDCLWTILVVITSILMALPLHKVTTSIEKCLRK